MKAKFTCRKTSMSIEQPLPDFNKIMARQPTRKLILGDSPLLKSSKKQRVNSALIIREAYISGRGKIKAIVRPTGARESDESFISTRHTFPKAYRALARSLSSLVHYLPFFAIQGLNFQNHALVVVVEATTALLVKFLQIPKFWKWLLSQFKSTKCVNDRPEEINKSQKTSSAARRPKRRFAVEDLLCTMDAYTFENFVFSMCILLAWWLLSRLILFIRRFYSKNVRN